ncbi:hypothetical protein NPIL_352421 [Nephila pilipes]|uniref:Uncharacterized protein n=1 Tax=Nephila pilipes TaxID=299642 RepID=A0A8X6PZM2_NEPPI|nr:hypothetical protein NPIL_352421 [Nephila pilipes]
MVESIPNAEINFKKYFHPNKSTFHASNATKQKSKQTCHFHIPPFPSPSQMTNTTTCSISYFLRTQQLSKTEIISNHPILFLPQYFKNGRIGPNQKPLKSLRTYSRLLLFNVEFPRCRPPYTCGRRDQPHLLCI